MPLDPHIDTTAPARMWLGGFQAGTSAGAHRAEMDLKRQLLAKQEAESQAADQVWRTYAIEYAMNGLPPEAFAADHMPNSEAGQRGIAMGYGSAALGIPRTVGMNSVQAPGAQPAPADPVAALQGMGGPGGQAPAAIAAPPPVVGAPGLAAHPDDERLKAAIRNAPASAIQAVLPHLQDVQKRRMLTAQMNHLIDQGLEDSVVTPHLAGIIGAYAQAGQPEAGMKMLADAYEEHGKHQEAMELLALRGQQQMGLQGLRGDQAMQRTDLSNQSREKIAADNRAAANDRFERMYQLRERAQQFKENNPQVGEMINFSPYRQASDAFHNNMRLAEQARGIVNQDAWDSTITPEVKKQHVDKMNAYLSAAEQASSDMQDAAQKFGELHKQGAATPAAPGAQGPAAATAIQDKIDAMIRAGKTDDEIKAALQGQP